ncbi:hypothetical protein ACQEDT_24650, partial [Agrobacterium pusense]|uniref:hypothetical protein n=1 Tax=Agrobacterium pusense TaxID=648995 RepID=UPI003D0EA51B
EEGDRAGGHADLRPEALGPGDLTLQIFLDFYQGRKQAWLYFCQGLKMQIKKGLVYAACNLTSGMLLHAQPTALTWM